jgi:hypothetical protein
MAQSRRSVRIHRSVPSSGLNVCIACTDPSAFDFVWEDKHTHPVEPLDVVVRQVLVVFRRLPSFQRLQILINYLLCVFISHVECRTNAVVGAADPPRLHTC